MAIRIDRVDVTVSRQAKVRIEDTLAFVEEVGFLEEFRECGLNDDDLDNIQYAITITPTGGTVVPVTRSIRDVYNRSPSDASVVIRYAYLPPPASTVLLLTAYIGIDSYSYTAEEATEIESYIDRQMRFFSTRYTT